MPTQNGGKQHGGDSSSRSATPTNMPISDAEKETKEDGQEQESYGNHQPGSLEQEPERMLDEEEAEEEETNAASDNEENRATTTEAEEGQKEGNENENAIQSQKEPAAAEIQPPKERQARNRRQNAAETPPTDTSRNPRKRKHIEKREAAAETSCQPGPQTRENENKGEPREQTNRNYAVWEKYTTHGIQPKYQAMGIPIRTLPTRRADRAIALSPPGTRTARTHQKQIMRSVIFPYCN